MGDASYTTHPTLYSSKSTSNDVGDTTHLDGVDMNLLQSQHQICVQRMLRTKSVTVPTNGTITWTPDWPHDTGTSVVVSPKDASAAGVLQSGFYITNISQSGVTVEALGSGAAGEIGSAYGTIFYT